ncbi:MAG: SpoIIIAH-like family protein [Lachnospiraceae bacterium]|nr:SpoIIIAH-like family protein [Lachnospiraceae bacterium]
MKISTVFQKKEKNSAGEEEKKPSGGKIGRKLRRNRMIITAFAIMIAVAGYLNYADRIDSTQGAQTEDSEAANAAADAVYGDDTLLGSDGDIESLDVDYDLVLSEDDLLEEVTETETAGDKDGTGTESGETDETGTGTSEEAGENEAGESGDTSTDESGGENTANAEGTTAGTDTANADGTAAGTDTANADGSAAGTDTADGADAASSNVGESLFVSSTGVLTFVAEAKLSREQARAKSKETLLEIVDNDALSESAKQSAIDAMVELSEIASMEAATETLLAAKGFTNAVVTIQSDSVDVIVNAEQLSDSERAQIEDIITQKTGISVTNITIVPLRESEE